MKKIFLTGSEGFIGSHLTEYLIKKKYKVTSLVQYNSFQANGWLYDLDTKLKKKLNIIYGDIRDKNFLINVCKNQMQYYI